MTGQLPPDFFTKFFEVLRFKPDEALAFQDRMHVLSQRKFLQEQLGLLPENERNVFNEVMNRDGVSAETINEFLEDRLDAEVRQALWQESLLFLWQEVLNTIKDTASVEQKEAIKQLVKRYLITESD